MGFLYLVPSAMVATLAYGMWVDNGGYPSLDVPLSTRITSGGIIWMVYTLGAVFWGSIFLGIPAVLVGLLRIWPMSRLFRYCLNDPAGPDMVGFLFGTFIIFEAPVVVLMLFISGAAPWYSIGNGMLCQLASFPWLCASLRTTYKMMQAQEVQLTEPRL
jgi:hypothetical protein